VTSQGMSGIEFVHGICQTRQDEVNADLLTFIQN
jgi:hypothetical protein